MPPLFPFSTAHRRHGAILAAALVCLLIVLLFAGALVQAIVTQRRLARSGEQQPQAMHLADAGLRRAVFHLLRSPDYAGETWRVPAEQLGGAQGAEVLIQVTSPEAAPRQKQVRVEVKMLVGDAPFVLVQEIKFPSTDSGEIK